jgi:predicted phage terminase large subunit-like protein
VARTPAPAPIRQRRMEVRLPPLHPRQEEVALDPARFKVVCCGRRWGKTMLGAALVVRESLGGGDCWWVAPSFPIGEQGWQLIEELALLVPGTQYQGRPIYRVTFPSGGTIQLKSAENPFSLRGAGLDGLVMDEAAYAKADAWPTLRPTLSDRGGWAMFISTPAGLNWFHDLFEEADRQPGWARWRFSTSTNPFMPPTELDAARSDLSGLVFSQEYEAEFVSASAGLFHAEWFRYWHTPEADASVYTVGDRWVPKTDCMVFATVDLAWSIEEHADYTVISTWAVTPDRHLLLLDVTRGHFEGSAILPMLRAAYDRHKPRYLAMERTTKQLGIVREAQATGLPIREVVPDKNKVARALPATARMEHGSVWFPARTAWMKDLEAELLAFPMGRHDDFVDTLAYAVLAIASSRSAYADRGVMTV